jgi:hypothetical protein
MPTATAQVAGSAADSGKMNSLVVVDTWDLGGEVTDAEAVQKRLAALGITAQLSEILSRSYDASFVAAREPALEIAAQLTNPALSAESVLECKTNVRVYPTGVVVVTWTMHLVADTSFGSMAAISEQFRSARTNGYGDWLRRYANDPSLLRADGCDSADARTSFGEYVALIAQLRAAAAGVIDRRPYLLPPFGTKYIHIIPELGTLDEDLRDFAQGQGEMLGSDLESLPVARSPDEIIRYHDSAVVASWGGRHLLVRVDDEASGIGSDVAEAFELIETYRLLARVWIDYLDRARPAVMGRTLYESDVQTLERELIDHSLLEQRISYLMIELDAIELAAVSAVRRRLLLDFRDRLRLPELRGLISQRLAALHLHTQMVKSVVDRAAQEAARRQADKLQMLFSGAVAASLAALIPPLADFGGERQGILAAVTGAVTLLAWLALATVVKRLSPLSLTFADAESGLPVQPPPANVTVEEAQTTRARRLSRVPS